jgi:hypothetical protein
MTKTEELIAAVENEHTPRGATAIERELARMLQVAIKAHKFIVGRDARCGPADVISAEALIEIERIAAE